VNLRFSRDKYTFAYRPSGWRWWDAPQGVPLGGGLSVTGGPSAVLAELVPDSRNPVSERNPLVAISLHELGNGWGLPGGGDVLPAWIRSEAHSGFLRAEGELTLGYCADANVEHANHLASYQATPVSERRIHGSSVEPLLVTLVETYGWTMFRKLYATAESGGFTYLSGMNAEEIDNEMVQFLSQQARQNLTAFFQGELGIVPNQKTVDALAELPLAELSILPTLPCHRPVVHATPAAVDIEVTTNQPRGTGTAYVAAPMPWSAHFAGAARLFMSRTSDFDMTTLLVSANLGGMREGSAVSGHLVVRGTWPHAHPLRIPVTAHVLAPLAGPVANSSFEEGSDGLPSSWSADAWAPGAEAVAFGWSDSQRHIGGRSVSITNLGPNDSRWLQTVTGLTAGKRYRLVGWLKGTAVIGPGAANINIFGTWDHAGLSGTFDWTKVTLPFVAPDSGTVIVACRLGFWGQTITGQMWCDDLQVVPESRGQSPN
jgi:hypothetical protein